MFPRASAFSLTTHAAPLTPAPLWQWLFLHSSLPLPGTSFSFAGKVESYDSLGCMQLAFLPPEWKAAEGRDTEYFLRVHPSTKHNTNDLVQTFMKCIRTRLANGSPLGRTSPLLVFLWPMSWEFFFTFPVGWGKSEEEYSWHVKVVWNSNFSLYK